MKTKVRLFLSFSVLGAGVCLQVRGQYYDFVMGGGNTTSRSIIRTIDPQRAVAYYGGVGSHTLAVINMSGDIYKTEFSDDIDITDIRIVGGDIFFCGWNRSSRKGILGHASVNAIETTVASISCQEIDWGISASTNIPWRLAAYIDVTGAFRVVAIGEMYYNLSSMPSAPAWFYSCTLPDYAACHTFFVLECNYSAGSFSVVDCKFSCDHSRYERVDDVVLTDNWLAIITEYPDKNEMIIHKCNKNNVVGTFDPYYSYVVPNNEGVYHCCKMQGDTIALVALYQPWWTTTYETHMRTVDLASMTMTSAQGYPLLDKAEPEEIVYMPGYATLVLLQCQQFPSLAYHYAYVNWKPYTTPPYYADLIYESGDNPFYSIDRLTLKYIAAAGGDYWMEKDVMSANPSASCYTVDVQKISPLGTASPVAGVYSYYSLVPTLPPLLFSEILNRNNISFLCFEF